MESHLNIKKTGGDPGFEEKILSPILHITCSKNFYGIQNKDVNAAIAVYGAQREKDG
jgi:hypothetical protein